MSIVVAQLTRPDPDLVVLIVVRLSPRPRRRRTTALALHVGITAPTDRCLSPLQLFFFHSFAPARAKAGRYTRRHGDDDVPAGRLVAAASRVVVLVRPSVSDETCSPLHLIYSPRAACICVCTCTCASSPVLGYALGRTRLANNGVIR